MSGPFEIYVDKAAAAQGQLRAAIRVFLLFDEAAQQRMVREFKAAQLGAGVQVKVPRVPAVGP